MRWSAGGLAYPSLETPERGNQATVESPRGASTALLRCKRYTASLTTTLRSGRMPLLLLSLRWSHGGKLQDIFGPRACLCGFRPQQELCLLDEVHVNTLHCTCLVARLSGLGRP